MMNYLSQAVSGSEETVSSTSFAVDVMDLFRNGMMQSFMALVREIVEEGKANVPGSEMQLDFLNSG